MRGQLVLCGISCCWYYTLPWGFIKGVHCIKKEAEITQMPILALIYGTFLSLLTLEQGVEHLAVPLEQVGDELVLLQRTLFPSGLVPTQAEHPVCSGKASGGAGQEMQEGIVL